MSYLYLAQATCLCEKNEELRHTICIGDLIRTKSGDEAENVSKFSEGKKVGDFGNISSPMRQRMFAGVRHSVFWRTSSGEETDLRLRKNRTGDAPLQSGRIAGEGFCGWLGIALSPTMGCGGEWVATCLSITLSLAVFCAGPIHESLVRHPSGRAHRTWLGIALSLTMGYVGEWVATCLSITLSLAVIYFGRALVT
jgi:hypothetical protein